MYKTKSSDNTTLRDNKLIYEDENCEVSYDLWGDGGDIGFRLFNKTDKNLYLNLDQCYFILNGVSNNYYKDRVYTNTQSAGTNTAQSTSGSKSYSGFNYWNLFQTNNISTTGSVGVSSASGYSVSHKEEKVVCIPSKTSKLISEYSINKSVYRDCNLLKYPSSKKVQKLSFTKTNSPLVFSNRLSYSVGESTNLIKFENAFYVSEISNSPESAVIDNRPEEFCKDKSLESYKYFKVVSPDQFYITYVQKREDKFKH